MTADTLDVYAIACLADGTTRVVDTALVVLVETGRVRVTAPGELAAVSLVRRHPVEAAVLDAVGPSGHRSVDTVRWRLTTDERILDVPRRLRDAGLLGAGGGLAPTARRSRWRLAPTYAGRHLLHELCDDPPPDDLTGSSSAMSVALHGRERMPDRELSRSIFEQPVSMVVLEGGKPPPQLAFADGWDAAGRARAALLRDANFFGPGGP